jgi:hypothetical protein
MKNINLMSEIKSLILFQERVLRKGTPSTCNHTLKELSNLLDFNSIFISNIEEMFTKYNCNEIINDYVNLLRIYTENIVSIIKEFMNITSHNIIYESSIEKRMVQEKEFKDRYNVMISNLNSINSLSDGIHFLAINDGLLHDIKFDKSVFEKIYSNDNIYWKTDDMIIEYLTRYFRVPFIGVKVASKSNKIQKIEFNGNKQMMKALMKYLKNDVLVVYNEFFFIDDIKMMMKKFIFCKTKTIPKINHITALDTLESDVLIEYPLDSFENYLDFLGSAMNNLDTKEIDVTLYRIGHNPAIFNILKQAVNKGIHVVVNLELNASGEWINQIWIKEMLECGIKVYAYKYGIRKVHAKLTLVKFHNGTMVAQIGTGNYHTETAKQYTDLALITADQSLCRQIDSVFRMFESNDDKCELSKDFIVTGVENTNITLLTKMIDKQAKLGINGYICFKCNSLSDINIIKHLNRAALSGCRIDLIVRGICTWIPKCGNVAIRSIVWDKLEHSRVYSFGNANPTIYIGSLDLVTRKIEQRIETLIRINDPSIQLKLCKYLNRYLTDNRNSWIMDKNGNYKLEG